MNNHTMEDLVSLCKRRGFIFQSNEIYGGLQGLYDYGPLGVELKNNLKRAWWKSMIYDRDDIEGIDSSILTNPLVLKYSGHEDTFSDPLLDCRSCKSRWRADHVEDGKCPGAYDAVEAFTLDSNEMGNLVAAVDLDGNTVEAVVADWMANNKDRWGSWIK